jgi:hypothetical protein
MLCLYINNNEDTEIFKGKGLRLGGSSAVYEDNDTYFGDLSAIIIENMPFWADISSAPRQKTALMSEWETKLDAIVHETIKEDITSLAGVPSWMLVLLNRVLEVTGKDNLLEVWPNLEVYFHGGVNFKPYREQYERLIPKKNFRYYETYNASEGFFAIQDQNNSDELLLMLDYGIFYEFIPMDQYKGEDSKAIALEDVELDKNYGHANDIRTGKISTKYSGFTRSVLQGCLYALNCDADYYVYVEQDCLIKGKNFLKQAMGQSEEDILIGGATEGGVGLDGKKAAPMRQQSLMIVKKSGMERFLSGLLSADWSDGETSPEITMERQLQPLGTISIPYGRSRPIDFIQPCFYAQHFTQDELSQFIQLEGLVYMWEQLTEKHYFEAL